MRSGSIGMRCEIFARGVPADRPSDLTKAWRRCLLEDRRRFTKVPTVKLALMGLPPVDRQGSRRDLGGNVPVPDVRRDGGRQGRAKWSFTSAIAFRSQPRSSSKSDGWLRRLAITQRQIAEAPKSLDAEVAADRGIEVKQFHDNWDEPNNTPQIVSGGINLCDFNRDGCLDMLITDFVNQHLVSRATRRDLYRRLRAGPIAADLTA